MRNTPIEEHLIFTCCKYAMLENNELQTNLINNLISQIHQNLNFDEFWKLCQQHRVVLLIHYYLVIPNKSLFPSHILQKFNSFVKRMGRVQLEIISIIKQLYILLQTKKIPHVFLKGPVLGTQLYGTQMLRYSCDIDLLVDKNFLLAANSCLQSLGFSTKDHISAMLIVAKKRLFPGKKDAIYSNPNFPFTIELHWKTDVIELLLPKDNFVWHKNIELVNFQGSNLPVLTEQLNILYLCLHAAKHSWSRAHWLIDIALFIQKRNIKLKDILTLAKKHKLQNMVKETFFLAHYWFELNEFENYANILTQKQKKILLRRITIHKTNKNGVWYNLIKLYWYVKFYPNFSSKVLVLFYNCLFAIKIRLKRIINA